jgi:hypothetical protein
MKKVDGAEVKNVEEKTVELTVVPETEVEVSEAKKEGLFVKAKGVVAKHGKKVLGGIALLAVGAAGYTIGKMMGANSGDTGTDDGTDNCSDDIEDNESSDIIHF